MLARKFPIARHITYPRVIDSDGVLLVDVGIVMLILVFRKPFAMHMRLLFYSAAILLGVASSSPNSRGASEEQALIVKIRLGSSMGSEAEHQRIAAMEQELSEAIAKAGGDFDGDEFGEGVCTIYTYGASAEKLYSVALPILRKFRPPAGSYAIKRYGKPGSKQDRVELGG